MLRRQTEEITKQLRQNILDVLTEPMTVRELNAHIEATYHNLNYHVDRMVELGCLEMSGRVKKSGATSFVYSALVKIYVHPVKHRKSPIVIKDNPIVGKLIELTCKHHWTKIPPKHCKTYIGSTLGDGYV